MKVCAKFGKYLLSLRTAGTPFHGRAEHARKPDDFDVDVGAGKDELTHSVWRPAPVSSP